SCDRTASPAACSTLADADHTCTLRCDEPGCEDASGSCQDVVRVYADDVLTTRHAVRELTNSAGGASRGLRIRARVHQRDRLGDDEGSPVFRVSLWGFVDRVGREESLGYDEGPPLFGVGLRQWLSGGVLLSHTV